MENNINITIEQFTIEQFTIEQFTIEQVNDKLKKLPASYTDKFIKVYPYLIEYVAQNKTKDIGSLISIAHMVYGWMPTIIESDFGPEDNELWEKISNGSLDENFFERIKKCINNSIIGGSKLLHFINPYHYAIWDSKVYKSITGEEPYDYRVNNIKNYISYIKILRKLEKKKEINEIKKDLITRGFCDIKSSNLRVIELILYYSEKVV